MMYYDSARLVHQQAVPTPAAKTGSPLEGMSQGRNRRESRRRLAGGTRTPIRLSYAPQPLVPKKKSSSVSRPSLRLLCAPDGGFPHVNVFGEADYPDALVAYDGADRPLAVLEHDVIHVPAGEKKKNRERARLLAQNPRFLQIVGTPWASYVSYVGVLSTEESTKRTKNWFEQRTLSRRS